MNIKLKTGAQSVWFIGKFHGLVSFFSSIFRFFVFHIAGRESSLALVTKATGESTESSTSLSIIKSVQNVVSFPLHLLHMLTRVLFLLLYFYFIKNESKKVKQLLAEAKFGTLVKFMIIWHFVIFHGYCYNRPSWKPR